MRPHYSDYILAAPCCGLQALWNLKRQWPAPADWLSHAEAYKALDLGRQSKQCRRPTGFNSDDKALAVWDERGLPYFSREVMKVGFAGRGRVFGIPEPPRYSDFRGALGTQMRTLRFHYSLSVRTRTFHLLVESPDFWPA